MAKKIVLEIVKKGIERVLPKNIMKGSVSYSNEILKVGTKRFILKNKKVFVVGGGKASGAMAVELEKIIGVGKIKKGIINSKAKIKTKKIKIVKAGHPIPNKNGVKGVKDILSLGVSKDDLVICLISGGGSALLPCPIEGINLDELQKINNLLLKSGANIHEINTVRKHLSAIKGGRLAQHFYPAKVVSLILSDVVGDNLDVIASGPTVADRSTSKYALRIIKKYDLEKMVGKKVMKLLEIETPKRIINAYNFIIGNNMIALKAMQEKAKSYGLKTKIITSKLTGETVEQAKKIAKIFRKCKKNTALILGGETTVTIKGKAGKGGRNQEYVAASLLELKNMGGRWAMASVGTDGNDFMVNVAGGVIDNNSISKINEKDIVKELRNHNSYSILKKIKGVVRTGDTGTNVCDIIVYVKLC